MPLRPSVRQYARSALGLAFPLALAAALVAGTECEAWADSTIKSPDDHPHYKFEGEPHLILTPPGFSGFYGAYDLGYGIGGRFSIPIVDPGFVKSINDTVAISFGVDFVHYGGCYGGDFGRYNDCGGVNSLLLPVALQWNFYVADHWSVFGEPGLFIWHAFAPDFCNGVVGCRVVAPSTTGLYPAFYAGARYHFTEHVALTMRIGYPTFSVGVSFM